MPWPTWGWPITMRLRPTSRSRPRGRCCLWPTGLLRRRLSETTRSLKPMPLLPSFPCFGNMTGLALRELSIMRWNGVPGLRPCTICIPSGGCSRKADSKRRSRRMRGPWSWTRSLTRCVSSSSISCKILPGCRSSFRQAANAEVRPNLWLAAFRRTAPPSELPCCWSNFATTGRSKISGKRRQSVVVCSVK